MRISNGRRGAGTLGLLGITILVLVSIEAISAWWMMASVFFIAAGIGDELSDSENT